MIKYVEGELIYPSISDYNPIPYTVPEYRGATAYEIECISIANHTLVDLFSLEGFHEFFIQQHCCINKNTLRTFTQEHGLEPEYWEHMLFESGAFSHLSHIWTGSIRVDMGFYSGEKWLFDKRMMPECRITVDGLGTFSLGDACTEDCRIIELSEYPQLVYDVCCDSKWNIPSLYYMRTNFEMWLEGGLSKEVIEYDYPEIMAVINYCITHDIITNCKVRVDVHSLTWSNLASSPEGIDLYIYKDLRNQLHMHKRNIVALLYNDKFN